MEKNISESKYYALKEIDTDYFSIQNYDHSKFFSFGFKNSEEKKLYLFPEEFFYLYKTGVIQQNTDYSEPFLFKSIEKDQQNFTNNKINEITNYLKLSFMDRFKVFNHLKHLGKFVKIRKLNFKDLKQHVNYFVNENIGDFDLNYIFTYYEVYNSKDDYSNDRNKITIFISNNKIIKAKFLLALFDIFKFIQNIKIDNKSFVETNISLIKNKDFDENDDNNRLLLNDGNYKLIENENISNNKLTKVNINFTKSTSQIESFTLCLVEENNLVFLNLENYSILDNNI